MRAADQGQDRPGGDPAETRFSVTAAKADEWIPINPGTDAALALGIAHVIVKEELYDKAFVAEHTFGFEDWTDEKTGKKHMGFKTLVDYLQDIANLGLRFFPLEEGEADRPRVRRSGRGSACGPARRI